MRLSVSSLGLALSLATGAGAATVQTFDMAGTPYVTARYGNNPGAAVLGGGPTGNFLRLASANLGLLNTIGFERSDPGAFCTVEIDFDFRLTPGSSSADGFGVVWLHTGEHGASGAPAVSEEPNLTRSVGVGFDIWQNGEIGDPNANHVSIHRDAVRLAQVDVTPLLDLDATGGQFVHATITILADDAGGEVSVTLTPPGGAATEVAALAIAELRPYEGRLLVGARTGGASANHDFDNFSVDVTGCPDVVGEWGPVEPWPIVAIHASLLPTGKVIAWDRDDALFADPQLYDPSDGSITSASDPLVDKFCSGHALLADGRLFVAGGHDEHDGFGVDTAAIYHAGQNVWSTVGQAMNAGRWYPTTTPLANGDVLVVSGTVVPGDVNELPQVYQAALGTWRNLSSALLAQPLYPMMFLAPNGQVFNPGPDPVTRYLNPAGAGAWSLVANTQSGVFRDYGSAVQYGDGKILLVGGGVPTRTAEVIDLGAATPAWSYTGSMHFKRRQLDATLLADGSVLVNGGTSSGGFNNAAGSVYAAELWHPATGEWSALAAAQERRLYHSTALLLPDGRVWTGGGGHPAGEGDDDEHFNAEIYSPPYLFRGARPTLSGLAPGASDTIRYGQGFKILTPDGASLAKVTLVRLGSVTHAFNQSQYFGSLPFTLVSGDVRATAPANGNLAPPGPYLLFLVSDAGVPSLGRVVSLQEPAPAPIGCGIGAELALALPLLLSLRRRRWPRGSHVLL